MLKGKKLPFHAIINAHNNDVELSEEHSNKVNGALWGLEDCNDYELPNHFVTIYQNMKTYRDVKKTLLYLKTINQSDYVGVQEIIDLYVDVLTEVLEND